MIEIVRDLTAINVLAKFENDPWKIMESESVNGACLLCRPPARPGYDNTPESLRAAG